MAIPHQNRVVVGIWVITVADAVRQGISLPSAFSTQFENIIRPDTFNWDIVVFGLLGPPFLILAQAVFLRLFPKPIRKRSGFLTRWVDGRWGQGSMELFLKSLQPLALIACGSLVLGAVAVLSCLYFEAPPFAFNMALFFLSGGIGFTLGRAMGKRLLPGQAWV